jgi:uncharacterized membrane protein
MVPNNLSSDHTYILRLLEHGAMDAGTLRRASFAPKSKVQKILEDLVKMNLIERQWDGKSFTYRKI